MNIKPHIVELEPGVWLATGAGDPPRTTRRENARIFGSKNFALLGIVLARRYRPFADARAVPTGNGEQ